MELGWPDVLYLDYQVEMIFDVLHSEKYYLPFKI